MISATIIADSVGTTSGARITTFELVMPKCLIAQFNKHTLIRNSAESSRARPTKQIMEQVWHDAYIPSQWHYRQRGMQPADPMSPDDAIQMTDLEAKLRDTVLEIVGEMERLKASKEDINRYLEPWMFATVVATATDWDNYWKLRLDYAAQGAHRHLAHLMYVAYDDSTPSEMKPDAWHLPYITPGEQDMVNPVLLPQLSAARCGRASYGRAGEAKTVEEDVERCQAFVHDGHWTPLEGPARLTRSSGARFGAYRAWMSLRKHYRGESGTPNLGPVMDVAPWAYRTE